MTPPPPAIAVAKELDRVMRSDRGRLLAALAAGLRDLSLAEEVLQEAAISALSHWGRSGLPASPQGWLLQVARRKAIDRLRGATRDSARRGAGLAAEEEAPEPEVIPDERLRLIFACCHPALEMKSRVALTLRTRLRADHARNRPRCSWMPNRRWASASAAPRPRSPRGHPLCRARPRGLARAAGCGADDRLPDLHHRLCRGPGRTARPVPRGGIPDAPDRPAAPRRPGDRGRAGDDAADRRPPRRADRPDGASLPPAEQDRRLWDGARIAEGRALLARAMAPPRPGPFQIKAAIADCQMADPAPDWPQIAALYGALWRHEPTPVVTLNAAVALAEAGDPAARRWPSSRPGGRPVRLSAVARRWIPVSSAMVRALRGCSRRAGRRHSRW
jgi:hypothetical protein